MAGILGAQACQECARAKRKCGKEKPGCKRCRDRGTECTYRPPKQSSFVLCEESPSPIVQDSTSSQMAPYAQALMEDADAGLSFELAFPELSLTNSLIGMQPVSSWFTSLETWQIRPFPPPESFSFAAMELKRYIWKIHEWLTQWVKKGSNTFIHPQLYRTRFPRCIQDAYTSLSSYLCKTTLNEQVVFQIIYDRAAQLVASRSMSSTESRSGGSNASALALDPLEHLARVQALLIYQAICLYDGDIRLRHLAESNMPILYSWMLEMVDCASQTICLGAFLVSSMHEQATPSFSLSNMAHCKIIVWYSWILAESIRRTWLVATSIQAIYSMIQQNRVLPCKGALMITPYPGVWEARSAPEWERLCSEGNVGLLRLTEAETVFRETASSGLDDFAKAIMVATYGVDQVQCSTIENSM